MADLRWQFILFHPAMTDDQIRELIAPYEPELIERHEDGGVVGFFGGSFDQEDEIRRRFKVWREEYEAQPVESALPRSFDADAWLRSRGFDPDELRAVLPRRRPDRSDVENSYDWVMKHRKVR